MNGVSARYSTIAIWLHWITAIILIYMLFWGEGLIKAQGAAVPTNPNLHASLGITILILAALRLTWRLMNPPPADVLMPAWQRTASHALHWLFYAAMILIPLSGMAALDRSIAGKPPEFANLAFFGLFTVPHYSMSWFGAAHGLLGPHAVGFGLADGGLQLGKIVI